MKGFYKIIFIACFAILSTFFISDDVTHAAWNNNAYDFYHNTSGVRDDNGIPLGADKILIKDGSLWYCQRGKTSTAALRYKIIGHRITYRNGGSTYTIHSPLNDGITRVVDSNKYWDGGIQYTYDLWEIKYADVYNEFIRVHGAIDAFSPLVNNKSSVQLTADTYVTTLRDGVKLGGSVDRSGSMSGVVFYQQSDYRRFLSTGHNIYLQEWNEMYNISCNIPAGKKTPDLTTSEVYVSSPRNSEEVYSTNVNFADKVYVKTGKDLTIRYDSRLSYALDFYGMHATFWDTTDFYGDASGTLAMDSKSNDWTISFTNNKWYGQLNGSFKDRISPNFKIVKNEKGEKELSFYKSNNPIIKTFIYKYYARKYQPINDKYLQNLFTLYMQEIKKETEKIFPNAKFVLFVYSDDLNDLDIKTIEQQGITVIELKNIINKDIYSDEKYKAWDKVHPNRLAWEEITPVLGEILQF